MLRQGTTNQDKTSQVETGRNWTRKDKTEQSNANWGFAWPRKVGQGNAKNEHSKTSFEKNCFSAWASTLNMGLINKVDMVCLSPVGYGV